MAVYDYSYKVYEGPRHGALWRWLAIPKFAWMELIKKRFFIGLATVSGMHFVMWTTIVYLYVNANLLAMLDIPMRALPPIDARFFKMYVDFELPVCFMMAFVLGADLISRDRRQNALVLYASKPIYRWEYFLGKLVTTLAVFLLNLVCLPLLLFLTQKLVAPDESQWSIAFWQDYAWIGPAILAYGLIAAFTISLLVMASSSLVRNGIYAGILFAMYIIGTSAVLSVTAEIFRNPDLRVLAPSSAIVTLGNQLFRLETRGAAPAASWVYFGIALNWVLALIVIRRQILTGARYAR